MQEYISFGIHKLLIIYNLQLSVSYTIISVTTSMILVENHYRKLHIMNILPVNHNNTGTMVEIGQNIFTPNNFKTSTLLSCFANQK